MVECWEEFISRVHNAVPLDPWMTNVQLLDIFIESDRAWLPWRRTKIARIGSMLNLGMKDTNGWKKDVEDPIKTGLQLLESGSNVAVDPNGMFKVERMADMQASIKSTRSFLASIGVQASDAQFNLKGASALSCTVSEVKIHRAISDVLMDLMNERPWKQPALWKPNISRPEFRWSPKRGKTLWVVTEIMYANKISMDGDVKTNVDGTVKVSTAAKVGSVDVSTDITAEKDGVWVVTAAKNEAFPFAFRVLKVEYDANGLLKGKPVFRRSRSLSKAVNRSLSVMTGLSRSASVSKSLLST